MMRSQKERVVSFKITFISGMKMKNVLKHKERSKQQKAKMFFFLSQTASSSGCERNWSVLERIDTKMRNRLEHHRLNDIVFVHYNLRLQNRNQSSKRSYDPIEYECIEDADFWVVEEEAEGELNINEIEDMLDETEPPTQTQGNDGEYTLVDEDGEEDDSEFNPLSDRVLDEYNAPMA